jgi:uncharacterized protein
MKKVFRGNSLEACLEAAANELNMKKEDLNYKVLENKKSFFRRKVAIEIEYMDNKEIDHENIEEDSKINGTIKIINGNIIVTDPKDGGTPAVIEKGSGMKLIVDGRNIEKKSEVLASSKIEVVLSGQEATRQLNIFTSNDKMEVYAQAVYVPKVIYKLRDTSAKERVLLSREVLQKIDPPKYTEEDIKKELSKNGIVYGIIEENFHKLEENSKEKIIVAKGKKAVDGENDSIEIKFETLPTFKEDKIGNIDFKSIGVVSSVKKGEVIAVRHPGKEGEDGFDVTGKVIKAKIGKKRTIKAGAGCIMKDENTLCAVIDGKPSFKGNTFYVKQVHELNNDVDLKTGNVCFLGDINVHGNIREGMKIECGNNLVVDKDIERSVLTARGNIVVKGSIVASKVSGGGDDVKKIKTVEHLTKFNKLMKELINAVKEIKMYNLLGEEKRDGEIIKILLENRFKNIIKLSIYIISDLNTQCLDKNMQQDDVVKYIRSHLMGMGPISIEDYRDLNEIVEKVNMKIEEMNCTLKLPVKVVIAYCQDSDIESSGDIVITSKGEYISNIFANGSIEFLQKNSVARGGYLKAKKDIKCSVIGSVAGVTTKVEVEDQGNIWADVAYHNTVFEVGKREFILDSPSRNVHAYLKDGDIFVDKLLL